MRVTPIYKGKADANDKGNYRPISVIGHIANIIEREITNQVVTYLESNNLLISDQSAYRAQHSTQTALHKVVDYWFYRWLTYDCLLVRYICKGLTPSIILY